MAKKKEQDQETDIKTKDSLFKAFAEIKKNLGEEIVIDPATQFDIPRIPLSSPILGTLCGGLSGGFPLGRIIECFGKESSGKSLIATMIAKDFQKAGKFVVYIDLEQAFSYKFNTSLGLDTSKEMFQLFQPNSGEEAYEIVEKVAETGEVGLIIFDSLGSMSSNAELQSEMGESGMATIARLQGKGLRKVTSILSKTNTSLLFINQVRQAIGSYVPTTVTPAGMSTKFFSSIRLEINRKENITGENEDEIIGIRSKIKCVKNKTAVPFKQAEIDLFFDRGFDIESQYFDLAVTQGIINKSGAWYSYKEEKIGQGRDNTINYLKENPNIFNEIVEITDNLVFPERKK